LQSSLILLLKVKKRRERSQPLIKFLLASVAASGKGFTDLSSAGSDLRVQEPGALVLCIFSFHCSGLSQWLSSRPMRLSVLRLKTVTAIRFSFLFLFVAVFLSQPRSRMNSEVCSASALEGIDGGQRVLPSLDVASHHILRISRRATFHPPK